MYLYKKFLLLLFVVILSFGVSAEDEGGLEKEWKLVKDSNDIQVYMRHTEASRLKSFRGVTVVQVEEPFSVAPAILDFEYSHTWLHFVSKIEELEQVSESDRIILARTELPWPLKDRGVIARGYLEQDPETLKCTVHIYDMEHPDYKIPDNYLLLPELEGTFYLELLEDRKIRITYEAIMDPGGYVPVWAANFILKDVPYFTLKKLRKVIQRPEYQGVRYDFLKYPESW